jgi:hypothetical protein
MKIVHEKEGYPTLIYDTTTKVVYSYEFPSGTKTLGEWSSVDWDLVDWFLEQLRTRTIENIHDDRKMSWITMWVLEI